MQSARMGAHGASFLMQNAKCKMQNFGASPIISHRIKHRRGNSRIARIEITCKLRLVEVSSLKTHKKLLTGVSSQQFWFYFFISIMSRYEISLMP